MKRPVRGPCDPRTAPVVGGETNGQPATFVQLVIEEGRRRAARSACSGLPARLLEDQVQEGRRMASLYLPVT